MGARPVAWGVLAAAAVASLALWLVPTTIDVTGVAAPVPCLSLVQQQSESASALSGPQSSYSRAFDEAWTSMIGDRDEAPYADMKASAQSFAPVYLAEACGAARTSRQANLLVTLAVGLGALVVLVGTGRRAAPPTSATAQGPVTAPDSTEEDR